MPVLSSQLKRRCAQPTGMPSGAPSRRMSRVVSPVGLGGRSSFHSAPTSSTFRRGVVTSSPSVITSSMEVMTLWRRPAPAPMPSPKPKPKPGWKGSWNSKRTPARRRNPRSVSVTRVVGGTSGSCSSTSAVALGMAVGTTASASSRGSPVATTGGSGASPSCASALALGTAAATGSGAAGATGSGFSSGFLNASSIFLVAYSDAARAPLTRSLGSSPDPSGSSTL
mmetsp:Transcript_8519/g.24663  ORF Transcript_8519/g.24663 Transcript_8519/m.24663 type:complete len:225 (-) Transcript_8519:961-1635(-)